MIFILLFYYNFFVMNADSTTASIHCIAPWSFAPFTELLCAVQQLVNM